MQQRAATIIPLGRNSRCGSSNLPEGSPSESFRQSEGSETQRAGPALPSYLVLHHAGFAMPATLLPPRWALTPPFHPYLRANHADIPKVFLRFATGLRSAGGIFSVVLSVTLPLARPRPLALPGALPTPLARFRCPDFPPAHPWSTLRRTQDKPAIVQLTRQFQLYRGLLCHGLTLLLNKRGPISACAPSKVRIFSFGKRPGERIPLWPRKKDALFLPRVRNA